MNMLVNSHFQERVVVHSAELEWIDSPIAGVQRRMLDRVGEEVARATTIVKYDANSQFSPHVHTGGEEFLVLAGVFQDEHGDFPTGSYIRNPPQSRHTPRSDEGCIIFVKLWQFDSNDRTHVRLQIDKMAKLPSASNGQVLVTPLYEDEYETVQIEYWPANTEVDLTAEGGSELLVLAGEFTEGTDKLRQYSWLRLPADYQGKAITGPKPVKVWRKSGHLKDVQIPEALS